MSTGVDREALAKALLEARTGSPAKRSRRQRFADISLENTTIVDDILKQARKYAKKNQYSDANRLLAIAQKMLDNNKRLQNMVGEVLSDVD